MACLKMHKLNCCCKIKILAAATYLMQAQTTGDSVTYVLLSPSRSSQAGRCICSVNQSFGATAVLWMMQLLKLCPLASAMAQQPKCLTLTKFYNDKNRSKIKAESLKEKKEKNALPKWHPLTAVRLQVCQNKGHAQAKFKTNVSLI